MNWNLWITLYFSSPILPRVRSVSLAWKIQWTVSHIQQLLACSISQPVHNTEMMGSGDMSHPMVYKLIWFIMLPTKENKQFSPDSNGQFIQHRRIKGQISLWWARFAWKGNECVPLLYFTILTCTHRRKVSLFGTHSVRISLFFCHASLHVYHRRHNFPFLVAGLLLWIFFFFQFPVDRLR